MTFTHAVSTDNYGPAKWIVDQSAANGTHTTIQAAITSASAGDTIFIRPGTYTENLTLKSGVSFAGFTTSGSNVTIIVGTMIDNGVTVGAFFNNIFFQTNSNTILTLTGGTSDIRFTNCNLQATNNTAVSVGSGCTVTLNNCTGDLGTTGIALWTGAGAVSCLYSNFTNSGSSTTASSTTGSVSLFYSTVSVPLASSGASGITVDNCFIDNHLTNATGLTTSGTVLANVNNSIFLSGSASCISIGSGTTVNASNLIANSSNTNVLTGSGTLNYSFITFAGSSSGHNVTTENALATLI